MKLLSPLWRTSLCRSYLKSEKRKTIFTDPGKSFCVARMASLLDVQVQPLVSASTKRLISDWKEFERSDLPGIGAFPLESNIHEWHANLRPSSGPYSKIYFHIILKFPVKYPASPPQVQLKPLIKHPNVFPAGRYSADDYICLDMLKEYTSTTPYTGWSGAYTVSAVLMQLMAFLFDADVPQEYGGNRKNVVSADDVKTATENAKLYQCLTCGHTQNKPIPRTKRSNVSVKASSINLTVVDAKCLHEFPTALLGMIAEYLPNSEMLALISHTRLFGRTIQEVPLRQLSQLKCFYRKVGIREDILGYGVTPEYYTNTGELKSISCGLDFVSKNAFFADHVRVGVWKEPFSHWLPLVFDYKHLETAWPFIDTAIYQLKNRLVASQCVGSPTVFFTHPRNAAIMVWEVIGQIVNSLVLAFQTSVSQNIHASERALQGVCAMHHLLLAYACRRGIGEHITAIAKNDVQGYCLSSANRVKSVVKNNGLWLPKVLLSGLVWQQVVASYAEESLTRNVLWQVKANQAFALIPAKPTHVDICFRLRGGFIHSRNSWHLSLFQSQFIRLLEGGLDLSAQFKRYNSVLGQPPPFIIQRLQQFAMSIKQINSYESAIVALGLQPRPPHVIYNWLIAAVQRSEKRQYHRRPFTVRGLQSACLCRGQPCMYEIKSSQNVNEVKDINDAKDVKDVVEPGELQIRTKTNESLQASQAPVSLVSALLQAQPALLQAQPALLQAQPVLLQAQTTPSSIPQALQVPQAPQVAAQAPRIQTIQRIVEKAEPVRPGAVRPGAIPSLMDRLFPVLSAVTLRQDDEKEKKARPSSAWRWAKAEKKPKK
jgi:ubiquitin-protein ligase